MDISVGMDEFKGWKLDAGSSQRLERMRGLFTEPERAKLAKKLELLASVHFLVDRRQVSKVDTGRITATLKRFNKNFREEEVKEALGELKTYGLLQA
ncbi:hypothetical protein ES703_122988 [subsurface metagenome]